MFLYLTIPSSLNLEEFKQNANSVMPPFNQAVKRSPAFGLLMFSVRKESLYCPLFDLFDACLISLEETEQILYGYWSLNNGTLTLQMAEALCVPSQDSRQCGFRLDVYSIGTDKEINGEPKLLAVSAVIHPHCQEPGYTLLSHSPVTHMKYRRR